MLELPAKDSQQIEVAPYPCGVEADVDVVGARVLSFDMVNK